MKMNSLKIENIWGDDFHDRGQIALIEIISQNHTYFIFYCKYQLLDPKHLYLEISAKNYDLIPV